MYVYIYLYTEQKDCKCFFKTCTGNVYKALEVWKELFLVNIILFEFMVWFLRNYGADKGSKKLINTNGHKARETRITYVGRNIFVKITDIILFSALNWFIDYGNRCLVK